MKLDYELPKTVFLHTKIPKTLHPGAGVESWINFDKKKYIFMILKTYRNKI